MIQWHKKYWLIVAAFFFITWKFFLITLLWDDRSLPPEPDDSLIYTGHIYSVIRCPQIACSDNSYVSLENTTGYNYLSYRVVLGWLGFILRMDQWKIFHFSFYIGTVLLVGVLIMLLQRLLPDQKIQATSLAALALYHGGGYHGFFWVVPSFFSLLLLLLIIVLMLQEKTSWSLLIITTMSMIYVHPLGLYWIGIVTLFTIILQLLTRKFDSRLMLVCGVIIFTASISLLPKYIALNDIPFPHRSFVPPLNTGAADNEIKDLAMNARNHFNNFRNDYLNWVIPHPLALVPLVIFVVLTYSAGYLKLLALYGATFLFALGASVYHPYGSRAVLVLWPITYILYAAGFCLTSRFLQERIPYRPLMIAAQTAFACSIVLFGAVNVLYSLLHTQYSHDRTNVAIADEFVRYVTAHTSQQDPIFIADELLLAYSYNTELTSRIHHEEPKYFLERDKGIHASSAGGLSDFFAVAGAFFRKRIADQINESSVANDHSASDSKTSRDTILERQFGDVRIYRNLKYPR